MPTLGEACARLRITRRTLDKWLKRLKITAPRHEYDWRYHLITEEDVERIRAARAEMPASASVLPARPPVLLEPLPSTPAAPRPVQRARVARTAHSAGHHPPLPDGWVAWIRLSEELHIPGTSARRFTSEHLIPFHEGAWDSGVANRPYLHALSPEQQIAARRIVRARRGGKRDTGEEETSEEDDA